jgi:hypothetical protein
MNGNKLEHHESNKFIVTDKTFYACSIKCKKHIIQHYENVAFIKDAFSGDTICKADALVGLKKRGNPEVIYFKNKHSFNNFYRVSN